MSGEIVNRVANSKLMTIDLEDLYPKGERVLFDISDWLFEGFVLKEKDFREKALEHDWESYHGKYVAMHCSTDAIIPSWAYLLLATYLQGHANKVITGDLELLENLIFQEVLNELPLESYKNKPVIIKGCSELPVPPTAYVTITSLLIPLVSSLMFGEACSTVPIYKKRR